MIFSLFWEEAFIRRGAFIRGGAFIIKSEILGGRSFEGGVYSRRGVYSRKYGIYTGESKASLRPDLTLGHGLCIGPYRYAIQLVTR